MGEFIAIEEGAQALAPELEAIGAKALGEVESVGQKIFSKFGQKGAKAVEREAETVGQSTMGRIFDVGTGVMIGQSLNKPASVPQPTEGGDGLRRRRTKKQLAGKSARVGGCSCECDPAESSDDDDVFGGGDPVIMMHPRPLAEKMQIGILVVLLLVIITVVIIISVEKPGVQTSFWTGVALGVVSGVTVYWIIRSRH